MSFLASIIAAAMLTEPGGDPALRERFLSEYPRFATGLTDRAKRPGVARVIEETTMRDKDKGTETTDKRIHTLFSYGNKARVDTEAFTEEMARADLAARSRPAGKKTSMVYDGDLVFQVSLEPAAKSPKVLSMDRGSLPAFLKSMLSRVQQPPYSDRGGRSLASRLKEPTMHVKEVVEVGPPQHKLIRVEFERIGTNPKIAGQVASSGWFQFDPSRGWVLESSCETMRISDRVDTLTRKLEYERAADGYDLKKITENNVIGDTGRSRSTILTIAYFKPGAASEDDFKLSAFQLPEVGKTPAALARSNRASYWFFGLAFATLLSAVLLKFLASRKPSSVSHQAA